MIQCPVGYVISAWAQTRSQTLPDLSLKDPGDGHHPLGVPLHPGRQHLAVSAFTSAWQNLEGGRGGGLVEL